MTKSETRPSARLLREVMSYLERNRGDRVFVQKSLQDIGEALGYSHASIHRACRYLSQSGEINIDITTTPHTIHLLNCENSLDSSAVKEATCFLNLIRQGVSGAESAVESLSQEVTRLRKDVEDWVFLKSNLMDESYSSKTGNLILTFRLSQPPAKSYLVDE